MSSVPASAVTVITVESLTPLNDAVIVEVPMLTAVASPCLPGRSKSLRRTSSRKSTSLDS